MAIIGLSVRAVEFQIFWVPKICPNKTNKYPLQKPKFRVLNLGRKSIEYHISFKTSVTNSLTNSAALLLDRRSIDLSGAREKGGHFHYKNFLRALK